MSSYSIAIMNLTPDEKNKLEKRINAWSTKSPFGQRVTRNIYLEHFLPESYMVELLQFIANEPSTSWKLFEFNYQKFCYSHAMKGGPLKVNKTPMYFGAAVEYETFLKHLKDNYPTELGYSGDDTIIKDFISRLNRGRLSKILGQIIRLKKYSVWGTWNLNDLSGMPFNYCKTNAANEIRANMGLRRDDAEKSSALLLFVYTLPTYIEPVRPTITDAELSQYFEPPPPIFEKHGWTVTWQDEVRLRGFNIKPRPECIHDSIYLSQLKLPVEIRL